MRPIARAAIDLATILGPLALLGKRLAKTEVELLAAKVELVQNDVLFLRVERERAEHAHEEDGRAAAS